MKLENQVTNLELSKKLKDIGVKQESVWYWYEATKLASAKNEMQEIKYWTLARSPLMAKEIYSAFTVAKLGERLPNYVSTSNCGGGRNAERVDYLVCSNQNSREAWIAKDTKEVNWVSFRDRNEANARAKLLIYILENKLITNNR